jgi:hypothetical protein
MLLLELSYWYNVIVSSKSSIVVGGERARGRVAQVYKDKAAVFKDAAAVLEAYIAQRQMSLRLRECEGRSFLDCNELLKSAGLCVYREGTIFTWQQLLCHLETSLMRIELIKP